MLSIVDNGPAPTCPPSFNMAAYVLGQASDTPDKIALSILHKDGPDHWTYARLENAVRGTATGLLQQGLVAGDRVLMRLGNSVAFPVTYLACIAVGLIPVPTSAQLTSAEVAKIAALIKPKLIVAQNGVAIPSPPTCPVIADGDLARFHDLPAADYDAGDPNRPAYIIFTSGTSGMPHAVVHAHRAVWARRMMWDGWYGLCPSDRVLHAGAFNWTYTLGTGLMDPWAIGATALIPGNGMTSADLPELLAKHDATIFAAAPGVYRQMLRHPMPALPALRHGLSAGEKLPPSTHNLWRDRTGCEIYEAFGMSECSTFISSAPDHPAPYSALGLPQPGRKVAIIGPDGPVPRGTPGTIAVSADDPGLMLGYLDDPDRTTSRFQDGWFLTGDTGQMDDQGAITYLGRGDDMMNAGGFRVSPVEVEAAMCLHPGITECAAVEVPVDSGATVIAAVYTGPADIPDQDLQDHAAKHLARYKQPRIFQHRTTLPRNANNKVMRKVLRDMFTTAPN